jgi:hypothetical protein
VLNQTLVQSSQICLDCRPSWIMLPTYDIKSGKCESVNRVNQMRFQLSLLHRRFRQLRVGVKRPLLRTGSVKCGCEGWINIVSRESLTGQERWISGADFKNRK